MLNPRLGPVLDASAVPGPDQVLSRDELYSLICTTLAARLRLGELPEAESLTALLELAAEPRKTSEYIPPEEAFGADMVMLGYQYLYNARSLAEAEAAAGCELWPVGAPTADGACGSAARTPISWAVSAAYAETGEVDEMDGAVAIQGLCSFRVSGIKGQWATIVGLPVLAVAQRLMEGGSIAPRHCLGTNPLSK